MTHPVRIGNAEREQTVSALGEHFAAGRLDPDEYAERVTRAYQARYGTELLALLNDLPLLPGPPPGYLPPRQLPQRRQFPVLAVIAIVVLGLMTLGALQDVFHGRDFVGAIVIALLWVVLGSYLWRRSRRT